MVLMEEQKANEWKSAWAEFPLQTFILWHLLAKKSAQN